MNLKVVKAGGFIIMSKITAHQPELSSKKTTDTDYLHVFMMWQVEKNLVKFLNSNYSTYAKTWQENKKSHQLEAVKSICF